MSTSVPVRNVFACLDPFSGGGHKWSVKVDVRDLVGHLDTCLRRRSATLAVRVGLAIKRLLMVAVLPLDFHGRLWVVRTTLIPDALRCRRGVLRRNAHFE